MSRKNLFILCIGCLAMLGIGCLHQIHINRLANRMDADNIVPFESTFRQLAPEIGWDWQLLAAVAWEESHFNPRAHSQAGACGVMQLMPQTAYRFGLNDSTMWVGEENIRAGVEYIKFLQDKWSFITNRQEQTKFVLASYNVGPGSIFQARREVREAGGNSYSWTTVSPHVASSYARNYVPRVLKTYRKYLNMSQNCDSIK